jgi:hypothetical protein
MDRSVADYAAEADVSERRVRKLAESGKIDAFKVGRAWIIREPVSKHAQRRKSGGRPLTEESAWELALMLDGYVAESHRPSRARARINQLKHDQSLRDELGAWLVDRAEARHFRAQPGDLGDMREDNRLLATGVSHPDSGLLQAQEHEAYVVRQEFQDVVDDYMLMPSTPDKSNVILRVISGPVAPRAVPRLLIAADLMDRGTAREHAAAREIVEKALL